MTCDVGLLFLVCCSMYVCVVRCVFVRCSLIVARCLLLIVVCVCPLLFDARCVLLVVWCSLLVVFMFV